MTSEVPQEKFEDLFDEFTSQSDIESAKAEKEAGLEQEDSTTKELIKSYPHAQDSIDLHNLYSDEAIRKANHFIEGSQKNGYQTIKIITGRGIHSKDGIPVLRNKIGELVRQLKKSGEIFDYKWAQKTEEKSSAIIVYL